MTLKQFFQLAGGILVGIMFWSSPLLLIIRLPLAILSILLGIGLAFLPFEERPLERWIVAFFRAIYSPTIFTWQKNSANYKLFQDEPAVATVGPQDAALKDYLTKTGQAQGAPSNLDKAEGNFLAKLSTLFNPVASTNTKPAVVEAPAQLTPPVTQPVPQNPLPIAPTPPTPTIPVSTIPTSEQPIIQGVNTPLTSTYVPETKAANELKIPVTAPVSVKPAAPSVVMENTGLNHVSSPAVSNAVQPVIMGNEMISTKQAQFSVEAAPPNPPTYPNVVVGQVVDHDRLIVEGAIIEIRDSAGRPIRAIRSNKVGHFITVTQLDNGHYEIITEKDGYEFSPVSFEATGTTIPPILVQGKRLSPLLAMPDVPVKPKYSIN
jgi:hypothetical protein